MNGIGSNFDEFLKNENILDECEIIAKERIKDFIYLIEGSSGSYEDAYHWNVCSFDNLITAEKYLEEMINHYNNLSNVYNLFLCESEDFLNIHKKFKDLEIDFKVLNEEKIIEEKYLYDSDYIEKNEYTVSIKYIIEYNRKKEIEKIMDIHLFEKEENSFINFKNLYDENAVDFFNEGIMYRLINYIKFIKG